jgi:hypothetical protein
MSHTITFDTFAFVKTLEESGIDPKQAEAIKNAIENIFDESLGDKIFTKDDGKLLKSEIREEFHKLKSDTLIWVIGILLAQTGLILAVIKLFH